MVLFSFPTSGNISWPFMVGTVVLLLVYYFGWARSHFKGPKVMGAEAELTEHRARVRAARPRNSAARLPPDDPTLAPEGRPGSTGRPSDPPPAATGDRDHERPRPGARDAKHPRLVELEEMVRDGQIDTIVVAITDMQGRLMGKRVQGQAFLDGVISHGAHSARTSWARTWR